MPFKEGCTIIYRHLIVGIGFAAYLKYAKVLVIDGNARAFELASAHSQDEARARDFVGDMSL